MNLDACSRARLLIRRRTHTVDAQNATSEESQT